MQKLINSPDLFVDEVLDGILAAHPDELRRTERTRGVVCASSPVPGKVGVVTGGGSGHLPVFMGYVGDGLADGAAIGNVFASPSSEQMLEVIQAVDSGEGVLQIYGNYGGDVMNFELAADLARAEGRKVAAVVAADDVASAPKDEAARRRGVAGIFFLYKIAGARAAERASLDEVADVAGRAAGLIRSMGVALSSCTVPEAGRPTFDVAEGDMEIGMGIHGEPGVRRGSLEPADAVVDQIVGAILEELPTLDGHRVDVLVNGLGATPIEELYILYRRAAEVLGREGLIIRRPWIGEYATSLEMAGASISVMAVDDELARLLDAPARAPLLTRL
jgi:dihydroxyacetone kinase